MVIPFYSYNLRLHRIFFFFWGGGSFSFIVIKTLQKWSNLSKIKQPIFPTCYQMSGKWRCLYEICGGKEFVTVGLQATSACWFQTPIQILGYLALLSIGTCHFLDAEFQEIWSDKILGSKNQTKKTGYILDSCARATQVLKTEMPTLKTPCIFFSCV